MKRTRQPKRMPIQACWGSFLLSLMGLSIGCGDTHNAETIPHRVTELRQQIRPTDGTGWNGNGYGVPAQVYDPPGGHFRIYYVTSTDNAVDLTDVAPKDGVPDFVFSVGEAAEQTYQSTIGMRGFRPPLDDSLYHDRPDYGGDGRYDIYLRWSGKGSDGYRVTESCTDGSDGKSPGLCAGYFVMNPSYKDSHYPSELDGIRVLTSHELFHSVQDAYASGQWRTFSEGTAVWNELQVFPNSAGTWKDYLGFVPAFFREPERPFDKSMGAGPAVSYAYGSAVFVEYLSERFSPQFIRQIWEGCEQTPGGEERLFLDVIDEQLQRRHGSSLAAAWTEFTRWNLLTAERAVTGRGYQHAEQYPSVRLESELGELSKTVSVEVNGLSARYLKLRPNLTEPKAVRVTVSDPASATPVAAAAIAASDGKIGELIELGSGQTFTLSPGQALYLVITGAVRGARARQVEVSLRPTPIPKPPDPLVQDEVSEGASGCMLSSVHSPVSPAGWLLAPLFGILWRRKKRYGLK